MALALIVGIITHFVTVSNLRERMRKARLGMQKQKQEEIIDDAVKDCRDDRVRNLFGSEGRSP